MITQSSWQENGYDHIVAPHGERSEYYYIPQPSQLPARLHHTQWVGDKTLAFLSGRDKASSVSLLEQFYQTASPL